VERSKLEVGERPISLDKRLIFLMAFSCGLGIANLYYVQPLLADIAHSFALSTALAGWIATLSQLGYAAGLVFIVPLGDKYKQRTLIVSLLCIAVVALLVFATAQNVFVLAIASLVIGVASVVPPLIIPFASSLVPDETRGRTIGAIMSGLLIGILLARTVSGFVGSYLGWRVMYLIAAFATLVLAITLLLLLPPGQAAKGKISYLGLLRSLFTLVRSEPVLQELIVLGFTAFGAFSAFWVIISFFLSAPPYYLGSDASGLLGLAGFAGVLAAFAVGKVADRKGARVANGVALTIALAAFVFMWFTGQWLVPLAIGVILLDLGVQANNVSCQTRMYSLNPAARSRLNAAYSTLYYIGGSFGSLLGTTAWSVARWNGVCFAACLLLAGGLCYYVYNRRRI
jgi:predicted MFS family arabinose efflux permease